MVSIRGLEIEAIRYTWNGEITGLLKASRKWEWEPKTGNVTFEGKDKDGKPVKVTYTRSEINAQADAPQKKADAGPSMSGSLSDRIGSNCAVVLRRFSNFG